MRRVFVFAVALAGACVFGAQAERPFTATYDLSGIDTLRVLPKRSPITVRGCVRDEEGCSGDLEVQGAWLAFGGTRKDAARTTEEGDLVMDVSDGFAVLWERRPPKTEDLLRLELEDLLLPDDVDLELDTELGDLAVLDVVSNVRAVTGAGDVHVNGADAGLVVRTDVGDVFVSSPGVVDLWSGLGDVVLEQTGGPRDAYVTTGAGFVSVALASDSNLDLRIEARGGIDVKTDQINTITSGSFARQTGNATVRVEIINRSGSVSVRLFGDEP